MAITAVAPCTAPPAKIAAPSALAIEKRSPFTAFVMTRLARPWAIAIRATCQETSSAAAAAPAPPVATVMMTPAAAVSAWTVIACISSR